ncbi:MAG: DUF6599 family protein [Puniceicoccaceae bacterium]
MRIYLLLLIPVFFSPLISTAGKDTSSVNLSTYMQAITPEGWQLSDKPEYFTAENLYEEINGRAEFYLAYNVIGMTISVYEIEPNQEPFFECSVYDMGTHLNAYGVYSGERSQVAEALDLGRQAYRSGASFFIWQGQYYCRIVASDDDAELVELGRQLAKKLIGVLPDNGQSIPGLKALPKKNRIPHSDKYFLVDAFSLDFMVHTFTAKYAYQGSNVTQFVSMQESKADATDALNQYEEYAKRYGERVSIHRGDKASFVVCDMNGYYDVVFQKQSSFAGVTNCQDENRAITIAQQLWAELTSQ